MARECSNCDSFDTEVSIRSPETLISVADKVRYAVINDVLIYNSFESDRELIGQPSFMDLDLRSTRPDVLRYHFECPRCGNCFGLFVETYHGAGGKWSRLGKVSARGSE